MADFGALFKNGGGNVNKAEKLGNYKVTYLHYTKLVKSPYQYREFSQEDIDCIVDLITAAGSVLQPVLVRKVDADEYEIIAGHQRCEGIRYLVEKMGLEKYALVPCMITNMDDVDAELNVVVSNIRKMQTPYETLHQINVLRKQIKKYPERFPDLPQKGTVAERVALRMGMSRTVVSEYIKISNNLGEKGMELFAKNEIDKSAAMELAGFPEEEQEDLIEKGILTYAEIKKYKKEKDDKAKEGTQKEPETAENGPREQERELRKPDKTAHEYLDAAPRPMPEQETCATSRILPTLNCIHRPEYRCFLTENAKRTPGNGTDCNKHCCWECSKHGSCDLECNASGSRPEAVDQVGPEHEAAKLDCVMPHKKADQSTEEDTIQPKDLRDTAQPQETDVIDGEDEADCENAERDIDVLKEMLEKEKQELDEYINVDKTDPLPSGMIQKKKLLVGALASMLCNLEDGKEQEGESQPELPIFKNNDQRKEWLRNYQDWGMWYEDSHIGVKYYRYQFDNGAALVAEVYHHPATRHTKEYDANYLHLIGGPEPPKGTYGIRKWGFHKTYCRQPNSETELVEFLKEIQKEKTR